VDFAIDKVQKLVRFVQPPGPHSSKANAVIRRILQLESVKATQNQHTARYKNAKKFAVVSDEIERGGLD